MAIDFVRENSLKYHPFTQDKEPEGYLFMELNQDGYQGLINACEKFQVPKTEFEILGFQCEDTCFFITKISHTFFQEIIIKNVNDQFTDWEKSREKFYKNLLQERFKEQQALKPDVKITDIAKAYGLEIFRGDKTICPFHADSDPSLTFCDEMGSFHCFGCGKHGGIKDFVILANRYGLEVGVQNVAR